MPFSTRFLLPCALLSLLILSACTSAPTREVATIRTMNTLPAEHDGFRNVLVISVAGSFASRAQFEGRLVSEITTEIGNEKSAATAYFTVVGRRPQLTRNTLDNVILARDFDAILFTRIKEQEVEGLTQQRPVGFAFDLFTYDYAKLNAPTNIQLSSAITFVSELYSVADRKKVWSIETLSFDKASVDEQISEQAAAIASQVNEDGLLTR